MPEASKFVSNVQMSLLHVSGTSKTVINLNLLQRMLGLVFLKNARSYISILSTFLLCPIVEDFTD